MTLEEEKALLESIQSDSKQFGILFDQFYNTIFGYVYRRVGGYDLSCDITAETFLKAYLTIDKFKWKGVSISAWLYKIATNEANSYFRKKRYAPMNFHRILDHELLTKNLRAWEDERSQLEEELKAHEEFMVIRTQLARLDVKYQEVIALRYFENKDNKEISLILEKPEGTIKSLLSRGLEKLRKLVVENKT